MEQVIEPDILADLRFRSTEEGGRETPISYSKFGCIFTYKEENFDAFLILPEGTQIFPGDNITQPIVFLRDWLIKPRLKVGDSFILRDYRIIAEGKVVRVFS